MSITTHLLVWTALVLAIDLDKAKSQTHHKLELKLIVKAIMVNIHQLFMLHALDGFL